MGTMTSKFGNFSNAYSYTLVTHTSTFDAASAITSDFACTSSEKYFSEYDFTATYCVDYTIKPTAASTAIAYRTAGAPFPPGGLIPISDAMFYDLYTDGQPVATTALSIAPNRTYIESSATPYVHFTAYEVESGNKTETINLPSAYVYPYELNTDTYDVTATGPLPDEFLQQIPESNCDAGTLQATVTVVIVVDLYYQNLPMLDPFIIHFESTALGFEVEPTAPGFDDDPVIFNNHFSSKPPPITIDDWEIPGVPAKQTTTADVKPNMRPDAVPTTKAGHGDTNDGRNGADSPQQTPVTVGNVGTIPVVVGPSSVVVIGSQTLQPGAPPILVGGVTPVSLVPSATAIVVAGKTSQLPPVFNSPDQGLERPPPILTIGSNTLTPNAATQFFIAPGQTLTPGGTATVDGVLVSLAASASYVVVGGSTQMLPVPAPAATSPPEIVVGGSTITAISPAARNPSNNAESGPTFVVGGQTLAPGGQAITVNGNTLSLIPGGSFFVVDGVTSAVMQPIARAAQPTITVGDNLITPLPNSDNTFVISGQTLVPGGQPITISGTVVSLAPSASFVVINGQTSVLANPAAAQITTPPTLTIGNEIFRPLPGSGPTYIVGSQTLTPGGTIVLQGTTISLSPSLTALMIDGSTSLLFPITNAPLLTIGSQTYSALSGTTFLIDGQTLTPGGSIVVNGTTISLAQGATALIYGSAGRSTSTALFPATTTPATSITHSVGASAGQSGRDGAAVPTSKKGGAPSGVGNGSVFGLLVGLVGLMLV